MQRIILNLVQKYWLPAILGLFLLLHLPSLLALPTFADEAIYIRWAQLLTHDKAFLFFSVNDGKPPLYMWLLAVVMQLPGNPVFLSRLFSVAIGLAQLLVSDRIIKSFGGSTIARAAGAVIVTIAPFWYFHHRMALMDGLLTLFLSLTVLGLHETSRLHLKNNRRAAIFWAVMAGGAWGAALWTKLPALFLAPWFPLLAIWPYLSLPLPKRETLPKIAERTALFALSGALGLLLFLILRTQPIFGALFARGQDFSFTLSEVLSGQWRTSLDNIVRLINWTSSYLRPEALSLAAISLLISPKPRRIILLWLGVIIFSAPLIIFGRTLHPRYFLPIMLFLTPIVALFLEEVVGIVARSKDQQWAGQVTLSLLIGFFLLGSLRFIFFSLFAPNQIPFALADRSQYLTEWSSGHGIREVRDMLLKESRAGRRVTVVTEGSFGTLPDALLLEFDRRPEIANLRIEGLAQYPVKFLPEWVYAEAAQHQTWLVVNENRLEMARDQLELIARFPRPYGAADLLVFSIKPLPQDTKETVE